MYFRRGLFKDYCGRGWGNGYSILRDCPAFCLFFRKKKLEDFFYFLLDFLFFIKKISHIINPNAIPDQTPN